jgi:hypothetical protein
MTLDKKAVYQRQLDRLDEIIRDLHIARNAILTELEALKVEEYGVEL